MIGEAKPFDPGDQEIQQWQQATEQNVLLVGDALGNWGEMLARNVRVRITEGDEKYMPLPTYKYCDDGMIEITCNLDVFNYWLGLFADNPDFSSKDVQDLYLASAGVSVELAYLGMAAKAERKFDTGTSTRNLAIERAQEIISKFQQKQELVQSANVLESQYGVAGAVGAVETLSKSDAIEINRIRYSLGAAMFALEYDEGVRSGIVSTFRSSLITELTKYEETLLDFLEGLNTPQSYAKVQSNIDTVKRHSFPHFLFAGTIPMGYNEVN